MNWKGMFILYLRERERRKSKREREREQKYLAFILKKDNFILRAKVSCIYVEKG